MPAAFSFDDARISKEHLELTRASAPSQRFGAPSLDRLGHSVIPTLGSESRRCRENTNSPADRVGLLHCQVFERVVETCIASGPVGGEGFAVNVSLMAADANKQRSIAGRDWRRDRDPERSSRAVKE
jgi:hypothetical protein